MSQTVRITRGQTPIGDGGTFSNNGYNLDQPSPVSSYVMKPVPNPAEAQRQRTPMLTIPRGGFGATFNPSQLSGVDPKKDDRQQMLLWGAGALVLAAGAWAGIRFWRSKQVGS